MEIHEPRVRDRGGGPSTGVGGAEAPGARHTKSLLDDSPSHSPTAVRQRERDDVSPATTQVDDMRDLSSLSTGAPSVPLRRQLRQVVSIPTHSLTDNWAS